MFLDGLSCGRCAGFRDPALTEPDEDPGKAPYTRGKVLMSEGALPACEEDDHGHDELRLNGAKKR